MDSFGMDRRGDLDSYHIERHFQMTQVMWKVWKGIIVHLKEEEEEVVRGVMDLLPSTPGVHTAATATSVCNNDRHGNENN